jgi:hypothetical protein
MVEIPIYPVLFFPGNDRRERIRIGEEPCMQQPPLFPR